MKSFFFFLLLEMKFIFRTFEIRRHQREQVRRLRKRIVELRPMFLSFVPEATRLPFESSTGYFALSARTVTV